MMENLRSEEKDKIKDIKIFFRLNKELNYTAIKDIKYFFRWEKETKAMKDRMLSNIKNLFEHEEENYYKPVRVNNFWSNSYNEFESNDDRNKTLSVEEYLNDIRPYLKTIINNLKKIWHVENPMDNSK